MQFTSPSRRALGVLAVSTIGLTSAVLGVTGVAQAVAPTWDASGSGDSDPVPAGICNIEWTVVGGGAGADSDGEPGYEAGKVVAVIPAEEGEVYTLNPGTAGGDAADASTPGLGGTNPDGDMASQGGDGLTDTGIAGGGGGAASTVLLGSDLMVFAYGADAFDGYGVGGLGAGTENFAAAVDWTEDGDTTGGNGTIAGEGIPCAPESVYLQWVDELDGALAVDFYTAEDGDVATDHLEYTVNGGSSWAELTDIDTVEGRSIGTISGLSNGTEYAVQLRAVAANGVPGPESEELTGTPHVKATAPTNVTVTTGEASLTVSWEPSVAGTWPIAGYAVATVWGGDNHGGFAPVCEAGPTVYTCTGPAKPGQAHDVVVTAYDTHDRSGLPATATSGVVAPSSTVPESDGELELPAGKSSTVMPGEKVTIKGSGYAPFSEVTVYIYSTPQVLTTVVTDGNGEFEVEVTIPPGLATGKHTLVAAGVDGMGNVRYVTLEVTVANGLAYTGTDITVPALGGVAALTVGTGLLVLSRRRKPTAEPVAA